MITIIAIAAVLWIIKSVIGPLIDSVIEYVKSEKDIAATKARWEREDLAYKKESMKRSKKKKVKEEDLFDGCRPYL